MGRKSDQFLKVMEGEGTLQCKSVMWRGRGGIQLYSASRVTFDLPKKKKKTGKSKVKGNSA